MAGLGTLARNLRQVVNTKRAHLYLTELDASDSPVWSDPNQTGDTPVRRFQYYPDTISDTKSVNYQTKDVPGGSLPLYQWVNGGERLITFTAVFTTDTDHYLADEEFHGDLDVFSANLESRADAHVGRLRSHGVSDRNVWIPSAIAWLRQFMLPRYGETGDTGVPFTEAPRKLRLTLPGTFISASGGGGGASSRGGLHCIMTQCDVTYVALFPSGNPRIAEVSLAFSEVPQRAGRVHFPRADRTMVSLAAKYRPPHGHTSGSNGSS